MEDNAKLTSALVESVKIMIGSVVCNLKQG